MFLSCLKSLKAPYDLTSKPTLLLLGLSLAPANLPTHLHCSALISLLQLSGAEQLQFPGQARGPRAPVLLRSRSPFSTVSPSPLIHLEPLYLSLDGILFFCCIKLLNRAFPLTSWALGMVGIRQGPCPQEAYTYKSG